MTTTIIGNQRLAHLAQIAAEHRLTEAGPAARNHLIKLLADDDAAAEADRLINEIACQLTNDPVYQVECERIPHPIMLDATSADDLADKLRTYLGLYAGLRCTVAIDLVQDYGHIYPECGATSPVFITEVTS